MSVHPDTIAALSTPPGRGAIAVVRLSGPGAHTVLGALAPAGAAKAEPRRATVVEIVDPRTGEPLDRAVAIRYVAPESYTGEDMVELSCHGGWLVPARVLDACLEAGAREAEPGEFTRRAYLNGKVDLIQAEAVADLIEGRSPALHRAALQHLERGLSDRIGELRAAMIGIEALLAHHVDFPEEDDAPVPLERIVSRTGELLGRLDALRATAPEGQLLREGALTVLAGRPNVGKSSLYNALLGEERAIVTEQPGTTRDALESSVQLGGYPFRLVDTAGLRESGEEVERLGIEVAWRYLSAADIVLLCVEAAEGLGASEERFLAASPGCPIVLVETKVDLVSDECAGEDVAAGVVDGAPARPAYPQVRADAAVPTKPAVLADTMGSEEPAKPGFQADDTPAGFAGRVRVSVLSGRGLAALRSRLPRLVFGGLVRSDGTHPVVTRRRQARALDRAREEIAGFRDALAGGVPAEIAATHLRGAETALEDLLGAVTPDDVLDAVFQEFCIGK